MNFYILIFIKIKYFYIKRNILTRYGKEIPVIIFFLNNPISRYFTLKTLIYFFIKGLQSICQSNEKEKEQLLVFILKYLNLIIIR